MQILSLHFSQSYLVLRKSLQILVRKGPVVSRTSCSHTQMQKSDFFLLGMSEVLMVVVKFSHCISVEDLALSKHHYVHI